MGVKAERKPAQMDSYMDKAMENDRSHILQLNQEFFEQSFVADPDHASYSYPAYDSPIGELMSARYGSFDEFISQANHDTYYEHEKIAWLLYDKADAKLELATTHEQEQPDFARYEPLLAYRVDKDDFYPDEQASGKEGMQNPVWRAINWERVEDRLAFAMRQPAPAIKEVPAEKTEQIHDSAVSAEKLAVKE